MQFLHNYVPVRAFTEVATDAWQGFFQVFAQGGTSMYLYTKHVANYRGSGGMLPREVLILDLLLDAIW